MQNRLNLVLVLFAFDATTVHAQYRPVWFRPWCILFAAWPSHQCPEVRSWLWRGKGLGLVLVFVKARGGFCLEWRGEYWGGGCDGRKEIYYNFDMHTPPLCDSIMSSYIVCVCVLRSKLTMAVLTAKECRRTLWAAKSCPSRCARNWVKKWSGASGKRRGSKKRKWQLSGPYGHEVLCLCFTKREPPVFLSAYTPGYKLIKQS